MASADEERCKRIWHAPCEADTTCHVCLGSRQFLLTCHSYKHTTKFASQNKDMSKVVDYGGQGAHPVAIAVVSCWERCDRLLPAPATICHLVRVQSVL